MALLATISIDYTIKRDTNWNLLMSNIEALAWDEGDSEGNPGIYQDCLNKGGNWNMTSICTASGFESTTCKFNSEINIFGVSLKGNYEKGRQYSIPWARYTCESSTGNCSVKQGLYSGSQKLA